MNRRTFLATTGILSMGLSGCTAISPDSDDVETAAPSSPAGTPSSSPTPTTYETLTVGGVDVPLVHVDDAYSWYKGNEAKFVDARGARQYTRAHVKGAVSSPARAEENWEQSREGDPTYEWAKSTRIVCYCQCPHHLSSLRAGEFIQKGYRNVYAINEGFGAWVDRDYPTTRNRSRGPKHIIRGRADASAAGEYAWAIDGAHDQQEATPIQDDGSYELTLHFGTIGSSAPIELRTPSYELTAPLSQLTDGVVTGPNST